MLTLCWLYAIIKKSSGDSPKESGKTAEAARRWERSWGWYHEKELWKKFKKALDKASEKWYNRKAAVRQKGISRKETLKKVEKRLDKIEWKWYNKKAAVKNSKRSRKKFLKKSFEKGLTRETKSDIILKLSERDSEQHLEN